MGRIRVLARFCKNPDLTRTRFGVFFLKNPNPTLFLIGLGKIRPIRVELGWVSASRAKIAILTHLVTSLGLFTWELDDGASCGSEAMESDGEDDNDEPING